MWIRVDVCYYELISTKWWWRKCIWWYVFVVCITLMACLLCCMCILPGQCWRFYWSSGCGGGALGRYGNHSVFDALTFWGTGTCVHTTYICIVRILVIVVRVVTVIGFFVLLAFIEDQILCLTWLLDYTSMRPYNYTVMYWIWLNPLNNASCMNISLQSLLSPKPFRRSREHRCCPLQ